MELLRKTSLIPSQQTRTDTLITFLFPGLEILYSNQVWCFQRGGIWKKIPFCFKSSNGKSTFKKALKKTIMEDLEVP